MSANTITVEVAAEVAVRVSTSPLASAVDTIAKAISTLVIAISNHSVETSVSITCASAAVVVGDKVHVLTILIVQVKVKVSVFFLIFGVKIVVTVDINLGVHVSGVLEGKIKIDSSPEGLLLCDGYVEERGV